MVSVNRLSKFLTAEELDTYVQPGEEDSGVVRSPIGSRIFHFELKYVFPWLGHQHQERRFPLVADIC